MATIDNGTVTITPDLVMTWRAARPSPTVVHAIIGSTTPAVIVAAAGARAGTLRLFFLDEADGQAAQDEFAQPAVWDLSSPVLRFTVAPGDIALEAVGDDLNRWTLDVPYQEVP